MKNKILIFLAFAFILTSCEGIFAPEPGEGDIKGIWDVVETSSTYGTQYYDVQISYLDNNTLRIFNFFGLGSWVYLETELDGNILSFENVTVEGHKFSGQGEIEDSYDIINFEFTVEEVSSARNFNPENVSAIFTKN